MIREARLNKECLGAALITDANDQGAVWRLRESGLGSGAYFAGSPRTWPGAEDLAVPPAKLGAFLRRFAEILAQHNLQVGTYYGHFGEGCVHCRINFDLASSKGIAEFRFTMGGAGRSGRRVWRLAFEVSMATGWRARNCCRKFSILNSSRRFASSRKFSIRSRMMNPGNLVDPAPARFASEALRAPPIARARSRPISI